MEIIVSPAARDDIRGAYVHNAERDPDMAGRVVRTISDAINGLGQFPLIGREGIVPGTRERILSRYPYKVVYQVNGNVIEIVRVLHTAQQWPSSSSFGSSKE